jgi:hypothetical protein
VFVLKTGISWNQLPTALVGCSDVSCSRRLRDWTVAGVWPTHQQLWDLLRSLGGLDRDVAADDGSRMRELEGGITSTLRPCPGTSRRHAPPDLRGQRHPARGHRHPRNATTSSS